MLFADCFVSEAAFSVRTLKPRDQGNSIEKSQDKAADSTGPFSPMRSSGLLKGVNVSLQSNVKKILF